MKKTMFLLTATVILTVSVNASEPVKAGDEAYDFSLKSIKGEMISLSQFNDAKGFILIFTSNTCPYVIKYEERISDLHSKFSPKGFPVVAINSNDKIVSPADSYEEMQKNAKKKGFEYQYLHDESQETARRYGATNTPHVYVLSKSGNNLKVEYVGAIDNNVDDPARADKKYVEDAVKAILNGKPVPVTGSKAIGCTIKWKKA